MTAAIATPRPSETPAFRAIFESEVSYVWGTLRRLGVREADLEDLAHDVFLIVHRRLSDFDPTRPLRPWLFGIAFRVASSYRQRAAQKREVTTSGVDAEDPTVAVDELVAASELRAMLIQALGALDHDRRVLFIMHEIDGRKMPEVAETLGIPLPTAYSRLRLAREQLQGELAALQRPRGAP